MLQTFEFTFVECCARKDNERTKNCPKNIMIMKDINDDEVVLNSYLVVLEVNERGKFFL